MHQRRIVVLARRINRRRCGSRQPSAAPAPSRRRPRTWRRRAGVSGCSDCMIATISCAHRAAHARHHGRIWRALQERRSFDTGCRAHFAKRDKGREIGQAIDRRHQERAAICLHGQGLVLRWQAFDRVEDDRPLGGGHRRDQRHTSRRRDQTSEASNRELAGIIACERRPVRLAPCFPGARPMIASQHRDRRMPALARSTSQDARCGIRAGTPPVAGTAGNRAALRPG